MSENVWLQEKLGTGLIQSNQNTISLFFDFVVW